MFVCDLDETFQSLFGCQVFGEPVARRAIARNYSW